MRTLALAFLLILDCTGALAHSPEGVDPSLAPWFRGLQQPNGNGSCCSERDCHIVHSRIVGGNWEVLIETNWVKVPPDRVLQRHDNPTGDAVLCNIGENILCFVPGTLY